MTTKDFVYLSLLAIAAVVFYVNGYYSGFARRKEVNPVPPEGSEALDAHREITASAEFVDLTPCRGRETAPRNAERLAIRAVFGRN